ncbi:hypothetical protein PsYK624_152360 [Phanerochaete sordida]|uniref:Uncharacterized protein n=1 Tax=Phanerochaete sordida TaxID=48140 RepID=A0A9P3LKV0_9APHY|nr:hypothetical protein PsYK624_152360 [Phanerochaete sordida]
MKLELRAYYSSVPSHAAIHILPSAHREMLGAPDDSLLPSLFGALEGTVSIVLTFFAGYAVARRGFIDHHTIKNVSKLCSDVLLPCLILVQMGPQLTGGELRRMWVIPAWGLASTAVAHAIAWLGCALFKLPWWVIAAAGRPNSSAMPLLLLQALSNTGVLSTLSDAPPEVVVGRAQALILLNVVIQETLTLQTAPALFERDRAHCEATSGEEHGSDMLAPARLTRGSVKINPVVQDTARIGLLQNASPQAQSRLADVSDPYTTALHPIVDRPGPWSVFVKGSTRRASTVSKGDNYPKPSSHCSNRRLHTGNCPSFARHLLLRRQSDS